MARLRRAVLLGARLGSSAGAGEGRRGVVRLGVERRGAAAAVRRPLRLARVALPRMPPGPSHAVSALLAPSFILLLLVGWIRPRRCSPGLAELDACCSVASTWLVE